MSDSDEQKKPKKGKKSMPQLPERPGIWMQVAIAFVIFLVLSGAYTAVREYWLNKTETVPVSQIAADIRAGTVSEVTISGDTIHASYKDNSKKDSRKESEASFTDTLSHYGLTAGEIASVKVNVEDQGGLRYWILTLAPLLIPVLLLLGIMWYLSRQVRGAGMQAFTFGRSMARLVSPEDEVQRVTFADVAGAREAKAELTEIVDFLKNPKKFIQIGARIPKGVLLMGAPGTGKCVVGETQVLTGKGLIPIQDIPQFFSVDEKNQVDGLAICTVDPDTLELKSARASHWYDLGEQPTVRLDSDLGITIEGTSEHPIVVVDAKTGQFAFRRLDEIQKGEYAVVAYDTNLFGSYTRIQHSDISYMLGVIIGDGCMTTKNRLAFTSADREIVDRMQAITRTYFGTEWRKTKSRPYDYEISNGDTKRKIISYGLAEVGADHKRVPVWVKIAPKEHVTAFLRGLFDTDGYVEKHGAVGLSSASRELIEEVHAILLNLGIVSRVYSRTKLYNGHLQHYITVYGDFLEAFEREIGFTVAHKRERLAELVERQRNTNINVIPHQNALIRAVWDEMRATTTAKLDRAFYNQMLYKNTKRYISGERNPSPRGLQTFIAGVTKLAPAIGNSQSINFLQKISSGNYFFTKITEKKSGHARVFDLTVPQSHNFIANGLVNHNTLLARAVAGEAGVPFFSISGSEFVEMFVGVGASRVRDLFQTAKRAAPAIVFMDEIDAVGRIRGTGVGGGNDEREQTLNQILVEMDGFEPNEKVIVMAASNRPDVLDPALLRPGRFDRRVTIDLPDRRDREEILKVHAKQKPLGPDTNLNVIAERTPGFSGADLANLMNEAAILAAREDRTEVTQYDLIRSIEKVMLGPERRSHVLNKKEKEITAYHEAGHALIASVLPYADPVHKVSIISRGRAAGYTLKLPLDDRRMQSKKEFLDDIAVSLGGYIAEKMIYDDITTGASNDLQVLTALARDMVAKYGMSEKFGPMALDPAMGRTLFGAGVEPNQQSEEVASAIDAEVKDIITHAHKRALEVMTKHRKALDAIAMALVEVENLERDAFEKILIEHGIVPKKKQDIEHAPLA